MFDFSKLTKSRASLLKAITSKDLKYLHKALNGEFINLNFLTKDGQTPLHECIISGNIEIMQLLVKHGASQHIQNSNGWFPIHLASYYGRMDMIMFLVNPDNFKHQASLLVVNDQQTSETENKPKCKCRLLMGAKSKRDDEIGLLESSDDDEDCDYSQMSGVFEMSQCDSIVNAMP